MGGIVKNANVHDKHDWEFDGAKEYENSWSISFRCRNGCPSTVSTPIMKNKLSKGICASGGHLEEDDGSFIKYR